MKSHVYVCVEYVPGEINGMQIRRVFSNESTAELWADQSELRDYQTHALESSLGE